LALKRILVIQTAFLGDVILATPFVRELHRLFPGAAIDVLTIPETGIVFRYNPHVRERLIFDKRKKFRKWLSFFKVIAQLRRRKYDAAFSIQSSLTSALLMKLSGISERIGFERQKLLTIPIAEKKGIHTRERYLRLLSPFFKNALDSQTEIFWSEVEEKQAKEIYQKLKEMGKFTLGMAPGSVWFTKRWPEEYFIRLLDLLKNDDVSIVLTGSAAELDLCERIRKSAKTKVINTAGNLDILETAALISQLDLMLTNDSAPLHIANAVKTDVLAIFGPTVKEFGFFPFRENDKILEVKNLYCRPCGKHGGNRCPEKHFRCMREVTPEVVYSEIKSRINP